MRRCTSCRADQIARALLYVQAEGVRGAVKSVMGCEGVKRETRCEVALSMCVKRRSGQFLGNPEDFRISA